MIYDPAENHYYIYNQELALTQRPPCSAFKIISSLIALENGIIEPDNSTRTWSGEVFWNEDWNRDIHFSDAFRTSCVWYFREVIDEIGTDRMQDDVDAWFTGFAETAGKNIYFCVYLDETANQNVSSTKAKEIAIKILSSY